MPIGIRLKLPTKIVLYLVLILLLVKPICRSLPHVYPCTCNWLFRHQVKHFPVHVCDFAIIDAVNNCGFVLEYRSIVSEEGSQDRTCSCCISCLCRQFKCDLINEPVPPANVSYRVYYP